MSTRQTLLILLPELILLLAATVMMTAGPFVRLAPARLVSPRGALALGAALLVLLRARRSVDRPVLGGRAERRLLVLGTRLVLVLTGLVILALAHDQVDDARAAEFFGRLLMIDAGAMLVAAANEMVFLFVGLELVSIPTYLLLYLPAAEHPTQEAATKYFFLSIFSSGLLLFGLAYLYGLTGVSNLKALAYLARACAERPAAATGADRGRLRHGGAGVPGRGRAVPLLRARRLRGVADGHRGAPGLGAQGDRLPGDHPDADGGRLGGGRRSSRSSSKAVMLAWIIAVITMTLGNTVALLRRTSSGCSRIRRSRTPAT